MSRSCHSAMFSIAAMALPRSSRARPQICSQPIGLRLCGIADEPFWPFANGSSTSPISVFCRPRISSANFSSDAPVIASAVMQLRVAIALDDLRRDRRRPASPSRRQTAASIVGGRCAKVPTAPEILPTAHAFARAPHARDVALQLGVPERQLQAERHRLGVHAVRAADHRRLAMLFGARPDGVSERVEVLEDQVARVAPSAAPAPCPPRPTTSGRSGDSAPPGRRARRPTS